MLKRKHIAKLKKKKQFMLGKKMRNQISWTVQSFTHQPESSLLAAGVAAAAGAPRMAVDGPTFRPKTGYSRQSVEVWDS